MNLFATYFNTWLILIEYMCLFNIMEILFTIFQVIYPTYVGIIH